MSEYKRLTRKDDKGRWVAEAGLYGVYLDSETHADMMHGDIVNRLAELENKIESGELVELPKKVFCGKSKTGTGDESWAVLAPYLFIFMTEKAADEFMEHERKIMQEDASR